jgi:hypothetical protein
LKLSEVYNGKLAFSWIIVQADKDEATHEDRARQHAELSPRIVTAIITYMADSVYISDGRRTRNTDALCDADWMEGLHSGHFQRMKDLGCKRNDFSD